MQKKMTLEPLQRQSWFRSNFSRDQINEFLTGAPVGTFICRESSQKGLFAISVQQGDHISNMLCMPEQGRDPESSQIMQMFTFGDRGAILFQTIPLLVEHFKINPYTQHSTTGELLFLRPASIPEGVITDDGGLEL